MRDLSRVLLGVLLITCGCAQVVVQEYQWQGKPIVEGRGGVMRVQDGVEVWVAGLPKKDFEPLVVLISGLDRARRNDDAVLQEVRRRTKALGADGYILVDEDSETLGAMTFGSATRYGTTTFGSSFTTVARRTVYTVVVFRYVRPEGDSVKQ